MTTDTFDTSIVDDSCLYSDIFTMQSQTLPDFDFGLEAPDIGSLLELFEENEKRKFDQYNNCLSTSPKCNVPNNRRFREITKCSRIIINDTRKENNNIISKQQDQRIKFPKVKSFSECTSKRKGISLLVKPKKVSPVPKKSSQNLQKNNCSSNNNSNINNRFKFLHLYQDHSYCIKTSNEDNENDNFFCKIPNYLTSFKNLTHESIKPCNLEDNFCFDRLPNYIKGITDISSCDIIIEDEINFDTNIETDDLLNQNEKSLNSTSQT